MLEGKGNQALDKSKGKDGTLKVTVEVLEDPDLWREGLDIVSKHKITLGQALLGCNISIKTT